MTHQKTDWEPNCAMEGYDGYGVWEYNVGPHEVNDGEVDGEIDLEDEE